jgi:hypothetical protein
MTSRFNRGSSPGRARDASQLSGSFEAGHKKLGGRKKGTRNLISPERKRALLEAAHRVGSDGNGKDGVAGYFTCLAKRDPTLFYVDIWSRSLELDLHEAAVSAEARGITNEPDDEIRSPSGRTKQRSPFESLRELPDDEVQALMRLAVERRKDFCKIFCAALLTPPKNWRARARRRGLLCDAIGSPGRRTHHT